MGRRKQALPGARRRCALVVLFATCLVALAAAPAGEGAFPGHPGLILFDSDTEYSCLTAPLFLARPNMSNGRVLTRGGNGQFSPDGKRVVYETCDGNYLRVEMIRTDGTGHRILTPKVAPRFQGAGDPTFAPDGRHVLFTAERRTNRNASHLWILNLDTGNYRQLTHNVLHPRHAAWSPRGKIIVFESQSGLFTIRRDGTRQRRLGVAGSNPTFSPNGHLITFTQLYGERLMIMRPSGEGLRRVRSRPALGDISGPVFSPNGRKIIYALGGVGDRSDLYSIRPDGTGNRVLRKTNRRAENRPDWQAR